VEHHQVLHLLVLVASAEANVDAQIKAIAPLARVDLRPLVAKLDRDGLVLMLAHQLEDGQ